MALAGNEILYVQGIAENGMPAATEFPTTTGAIAALAGAAFGSDVNTAISTVGAGTLTAAAIVGGVITRTGPVAAYTDTTATSAQIYSQMGSVTGSFYIMIKNTVPFTQTLTNGSGVTITGTIIPANSVATYLVTQVSAGATTMLQIEVVTLSTSTLEIATALTTVGAGTITGAGIAGGITTRGGAQAFTAFTDTTDSAANIITGRLNVAIGGSWEYTYANHTNAVATIGNGSGVTVSAVTIIPANSWANYLVTYTAANTITMMGIQQGYYPSAGTVIVNGVTPATVTNAAVTGGSHIEITLKTVGGTVSATRPNVLTITPGTGFTVGALASDTSTYNYEIRG